MHRHLLLLFLLILSNGLDAKDNGTTFFAEAMPQHEKGFTEGDSMLVTVWLYSQHPFGDIRCEQSKFKINGATVRTIYTAQGRGRQQRTRKDGRIYYCAAAVQYMVSAPRPGTLTFPSLQFSATLYLEQEQDIDPFDPFGFFRQPTYKKQQKTCTSPALKIQVTKPPLKSTEELIRSGKTVI